MSNETAYGAVMDLYCTRCGIQLDWVFQKEPYHVFLTHAEYGDCINNGRVFLRSELPLIEARPE